MSEDNPLLIIRVDGEIVAEATLVIHEAPAAWRAFQDAYANLAHLVAGELFNTMRVACDPVLKANLGPQGMVIDLKTHAPQIVVPGNGFNLQDRGF